MFARIVFGCTEPVVQFVYMMWSLVVQTLSFRIVVVVIDYMILAVVLQRPLEAGVITIIRHGLHTFMYWGHEVAWAHRWFNTAAFLPGSRRYTLGKTISFRVLSLIADFTLFILLTGDVGVSSVGTLLIGVSNTIFFYFHDRWWQRWRVGASPLGRLRATTRYIESIH